MFSRNSSSSVEKEKHHEPVKPTEKPKNSTANGLKNHSPEESRGKKTRLVIHFDCGFTNFISIRGEGAGLKWTQGIQLKNTKNDEWVFETDAPFVNCEFKVLINDEIYESGPNHPLICGTNTQHTPYF